MVTQIQYTVIVAMRRKGRGKKGLRRAWDENFRERRNERWIRRKMEKLRSRESQYMCKDTMQENN